MSNAQSGFTANFPHMMNEQTKHIGWIIKQCAERQVRTVEASADAEAEWVRLIESLAIMRQKFLEECTPGYYNNEGQPSARAARNSPYGAGPIAFVKVLEDWRAEGSLKGLELGRE
jgi:cyclohexanone monooxygenase